MPLSSSKQRRNTVYDLTALRIHHDDFRIPSAETNYRYRRDKKITRDVRGNWVAKDAGGMGKVPWYKKVEDEGEGDEGEGEDIDLDGVERRVSKRKRGKEKDNPEEEEGEDEDEDEGEGKDSSSGSEEEYRRGHRRHFYEDLSYLDDPVEVQQPSGSLPVPDSVSIITSLRCKTFQDSMGFIVYVCRTSLRLFTTLQVYITTTWDNYMILKFALHNSDKCTCKIHRNRLVKKTRQRYKQSSRESSTTKEQRKIGLTRRMRNRSTRTRMKMKTKMKNLDP